MKTYWLNFHANYACGHSGACCSSGWAIPVERERVVPIRSLAGRTGDSWLVAEPNAPDDVAGTLAVRPNGECVFHQSGGCGVYAARPSSCAHFPYLCLVDPRGVRVTLSHYCPTAVALLFGDAGPIAVVEGPSPVPGFDIPEGLDARESLPPTVAGATADRSAPAQVRLMSWDEFDEWERQAVAGSEATAGPPDLALFEHARFAVPAPWSWPEAPAGLEEQWETLVARAWTAFAPVVRRYRAAKVFASWAAYTGDGLAAVLRLADIAEAVLQVESVRQCVAAARPLDAELLRQAIRQSDLLVVHYADGWVLSSATTP